MSGLGDAIPRTELIRLARAMLAQLVPCRHSIDFASVAWHDQRYVFTALQSHIVKLLWEAMENGTPEVRGETLMEAAGVDRENSQVSRVFAGHPAWGVMIIPGSVKGTCRLADPSVEPNDV